MGKCHSFLYSPNYTLAFAQVKINFPILLMYRKCLYGKKDAFKNFKN